MNLGQNKDLYREAFNEKYADDAAKMLKDAVRNDIQEMMTGAVVNKAAMSADTQKFYQGLQQNLLCSKNGVKMAVTDPYMPTQDVERVLDNIKADSALLKAIKMVATDKGIIDVVTNGGGADHAVWGALTSEIVHEVEGKVKTERITLEKLSAFMQLSEDFVRLKSLNYLQDLLEAELREAMVLGLEKRIVDDMIAKKTADNVVEKEEVTTFEPASYLPLVRHVLTDDNGRAKRRDKIFLACNQATYFDKIAPAMQLVNAQGQVVEVMPFPTEVVIVDDVPNGEAILFDAEAYMLAVNKQIEFTSSSDYKFLEDILTAKAVTLAGGLVLDNSAVILDVKALEPAHIRVKNV